MLTRCANSPYAAHRGSCIIDEMPCIQAGKEVYLAMSGGNQTGDIGRVVNPILVFENYSMCESRKIALIAFRGNW